MANTAAPLLPRSSGPIALQPRSTASLANSTAVRVLPIPSSPTNVTIRPTPEVTCAINILHRWGCHTLPWLIVDPDNSIRDTRYKPFYLTMNVR